MQNIPKNADGQISLKLKTKIKISGDTYIFRFEFPDLEMQMGLPVGNHVMFHAKVDGDEDEIIRKYTPISDVKDQSFVDFVIKIYRKNAHPKFPEGGQMTQYLEKLPLGSNMLISGPHGKLTYEGFGRFSIDKRLTQVRKKIGHIAGGTGITPIY